MRSNKIFRNYTLIGIAIGFGFPLFSTIIETTNSGLSLTFGNMLQVQRETVLLWVIDLAPLVIGFLSGLVGYRQQRLHDLNQFAEQKYQEELRLRTEIDQINQELEQRVLERTEEVEKRSSYIEAAAEIGRAATSIYKLDELIPEVVNLISDKFEFYQVGIFTMDAQNEYAVMLGASSEGGQRMLARKHRLKVGEQGIVGYVTHTGQARIALDVGKDAVHFNTPELPHTRSEMALPLFYGGRIYGALDVQSTEPNAFSEQDISALRVLADQVSMAISNAILFEELQESLVAERKAYEKISAEAWRDFIQHSSSLGYIFSQDRIRPTDSQWPDDMVQALKENHLVITQSNHPSLNIPVKIGSDAIGVIRLRKGDDQLDWSQDEIELIQVLTERLSQALESARLFQATQIQATQEQMISDISTQLRQTLDLDTVLKTAAKQLGEAFTAKEVVIRMGPYEPR
jgi:GAF domain-containing protein